jgi:hypothetical protein
MRTLECRRLVPWLAGLKAWARLRPGRALAVALFVGCVLMWAGYELKSRDTAEDRYLATVAEADRLDPGWRDGITPTDPGPIPDDQNAANLVVSSYEQMPPGWDSSEGSWLMIELDPARPIAPELMIELRQQRDEATEGLPDARALADRPRGRFPMSVNELPSSVPLARQQAQPALLLWTTYNEFVGSMPIVGQQVLAVVRLLYFDGLIRIEKDDSLGAARNVKAMINAGRAIGDQPLLAFQAARATAIDTAVLTLERLLAHGELPEPVLADLQKLLESEASHSLALISWRGERAAADKLFEDVRSGRAAAASLVEPGEGKLTLLYAGRTIRENQARLLELNNRLVELAKLPIEQQGPAFMVSEDAFFKLWHDANILKRVYRLPFREHTRVRAGGLQSAHHARANLAILALASDRFRLANGHWPNSAAELAPAYLAAVPYDPYTGAPLHFKPRQEQLLLYSNGRDGKDDGGLWVRGSLSGGDKDVGFILDSLEKRHRSVVRK